MFTVLKMEVGMGHEAVQRRKKLTTRTNRKGSLLKVHLTPEFFFAKTNPLIFCGISVQKCFDLVKSSIFCALLKYGKSV